MAPLQETVREYIETKQDEHDWEFLYIGASQDAALTAERVGIDRQHSLNISPSGESPEQLTNPCLNEAEGTAW